MSTLIVAGTGHRPKSLPCLYDENHQWAVTVKNNLNNWLVENKPTVVISGMAIGWDTWLAEAALSNDIELHCYIPFDGQEDRWSKKDQHRYHNIIKQAAFVKYPPPSNVKQSYLDRNIMMVKEADTVLALFNILQITGGTAHAISYANQLNKKIVNFWC
jgi:uncharacterized phage-like protein YoqJ